MSALMHARTAAAVCGAIGTNAAAASNRIDGNRHVRRSTPAFGPGHWRARVAGAASGTPGFHDRYGLPLSTRSAVAARRYREGIDRVLSGQPGAEERIRRAIAADGGFPLAHAALALLLHRRGNETGAVASIRRTSARLGSASLRERQHVAAIAAAVDGDAGQALRLIRSHLSDFPRDALLLQEAEELITWSRSVRLREERLALLASVASHYHDDWWFPGDYAFDLAELGRLDQARRLAEGALARNRDHAGAAHSLAHVFYEAGDYAGGVAFLRAWLPGYDRRGAEHSHLTWHLALFELGRGQSAQAMAVYARDLDPAAAPNRRLCDAASFLWRRHLAQPG
ncbi:MAG: hypothetical protein ACRDJN_14560, partial [Chloroflexota bacterium]